MSKTIFITGVSGQVGSMLAEKYLERGDRVIGMKRRASSHNTERIDHLFDNPNLKVVYGDITDYASIAAILMEDKPDVLINTACMSHVAVSFKIPLTAFASATGAANCLEAIRLHSPKTHFVQMSSSEMFGNGTPEGELMNEKSPLQPVSPYAVGKVSAHQMTINYAESYGLHCSSAICFNIESSRRGPTFVSAKIVNAACRISFGLQDKLLLGNANSIRNWNYLGDTCDALMKIADHDESDVWVIGTNESYTVEHFAKIAFDKVGINYKDYVEFNVPQYIRPLELNYLRCDSEKIRKKLNWSPKFKFDDTVSEMINEGMKKAKQELFIKGHK